MQRKHPKHKNGSDLRREEKRKRFRVLRDMVREAESIETQWAEESWRSSFKYRDTTKVGALPISDAKLTWFGQQVSIENLIVKVFILRTLTVDTPAYVHLCAGSCSSSHSSHGQR
jgi:hypothetical protein